MTTRGQRPRRQSTATAPATAAQPYRLEDQIGFRLRKAHQRATEIFGEVMRPLDVTPMQLAALVKLDDLGPVSQNQLGRHVAMDPATTFGVVGRLVRRHLISQRIDAGDARLTILELTGEGRAMVARIRALGGEVSRRTLAPLSPAEARTLLALLERIG